MRLGTKAMASVLVVGSIDLCWRPVVYRTGAVTRELIEGPSRGAPERRWLKAPPAANRFWRRAPELARLAVR